MNIHPENIVVNSCEYTPVYLIPNSGVTQRGSYYLTSNSKDVQLQKPVSDNLKRFYENSGNLESSVVSSSKPRILKKQSSSVVGNNLKLASFLLPKSEPQAVIQNGVNSNVTIPSKAILTPATNVVLKPTVTTLNVTKTVDNCGNDTNANCVNTPTLPIMEVDRKIVRVGTIPATSKFIFPKVPPKILPKEPLPPPVPSVPVPIVPVTTASNTTSVQLIKLGQTYHSLNQLSDEQMRIVNTALKLFSSGPEKPKEPIYEPEANPKFIYKLVSTKDLSTSSRNKLVTKKRNDIKKNPLKKVDKKETKQDPVDDEEIPAEPKVTRSGRTVKQSRHIRCEEPQKPKKKITTSVVHCFQCHNEFTSLYRLQRHYENFPTHIPERVHTNLFHCLQAILKGTSKDNQAHMFVQQLDHLLQKLRTLLPCLLKKMDGCEGSPCNISNEIGGLFGMSPGRYNLNMEALTCIKDTEGHCIHNPPPPKAAPIPNITIHSRVRITNEEELNNSETEDCARINSVDKWPTISKRIQNKKRAAAEKFKAKRIRLASEKENGDGIELSIDDVVTLTQPQDQNKNGLQKMVVQTPNILVENPKMSIDSPQTLAEVSNSADDAIMVDAPEKPPEEPKHLEKNAVKKVPSPVLNNQPDNEDRTKGHTSTQSTSTDQSILSHPIKFYSTHFDIRSSPIKLPSALVKKFQLKPEDASSYEVQILRPIIPENDNEVHQSQNDSDKHGNENIVHENEGSLSNDVSFSLDQMFPDNEISKEVLNELNDLSFQSNIFDSPLTKALKEINHFDQSLDKQILFDPNIMDVNSDANIEPTMSLKHKVDGYFEPSAIHVKMEKPNGICKSALSHVKERSKILFEVVPTPEQMNIIDQLQVSEKPHSLFDKSSSNMYESTAILKENGINRSQLRNKNHSIFESGIKHSKDDTLVSMIDEKSNDMMVPIPAMLSNEQSLLDKPTSIIDSSLMDDKHLGDLGHSDFSPNDSRLLSNQGQSVLTFLESLGNDCLAYPETEIRNNTEDFQLDLFSFSNT